MLDFDIFTIYTEDNEYKGSDKEAFLSFEDAMNNRHKYANCFLPNGDIWIRRCSEGKIGKCVEEWHIRSDGTIQSHYIW